MRRGKNIWLSTVKKQIHRRGGAWAHRQTHTHGWPLCTAALNVAVSALTNLARASVDHALVHSHTHFLTYCVTQTSEPNVTIYCWTQDLVLYKRLIIHMPEHTMFQQNHVCAVTWQQESEQTSLAAQFASLHEILVLHGMLEPTVSTQLRQPRSRMFKKKVVCKKPEWSPGLTLKLSCVLSPVNHRRVISGLKINKHQSVFQLFCPQVTKPRSSEHGRFTQLLHAPMYCSLCDYICSMLAICWDEFSQSVLSLSLSLSLSLYIYIYIYIYISYVWVLLHVLPELLHHFDFLVVRVEADIAR